MLGKEGGDEGGVKKVGSGDIHCTGMKDRRNKADRPANSRERWAGPLMEVRSLFLVVTDGRTDGRTYGQTNRLIESLVRD